MNRVLAFFATVAGTVSVAQADTAVSPLVMGGDVYDGLTVVVSSTTNAKLMAVNNSGTWMIGTAAGDSPTDMIIRGTGPTLPGTIYMKEGMLVPEPAPAGAALVSVSSMSLNNSGNVAFNLFLDPPTAWDAVFFNTDLVLQEGDVASAPGFSAGADYTGWSRAYLNDLNQVLIVGAVDDPAVPTAAVNAIVRVDDPAGAATQTLLAKAGDALVPGRTVASFGNNPHNHAIADGYAIVRATLDNGDTTNDVVIAVYNGSAPGGPAWSVAAREGSSVDAVPGRTWGANGTGSSTAADINNSGDWVVRGQLNAPAASDLVIVKNGTELIAQEGSQVPGLADGIVFAGFGNGPVQIDNAGNVYYFGSWSGGAGLFRNNEPIVEQGVTLTTTGEFTELVTAIANGQNTFAVSDNGRFVVFRGTLQNLDTLSTRQGTILVDLGTDCPADFDTQNGVQVADIFAFLRAWFAQDPRADFDGANGIQVADIFAFLRAWFAGCP